MNQSGPVASCFRKFLIYDSISLIVIGLFKNVYFCMSFGRLFLSRNWSFHLRFKIYGHRIVHSIPLLSFSMGYVVIPHLSFFYISILYPLFIFLILANGLPILLIFTKNQLLFLLISCFQFL